MRALVFLACSLALLATEIKTTDRTIPLIQDGGGYSTTITVVNLETTAATFTLLLLSDTGDFWQLPVKGPASVAGDGAYVNGSLGPGRSVTFQTAGSGADISSGHASIYSNESARLGVTATVRRSDGSTVLRFSVSPEREDFIRLPFDNTGGSSTALYWVSDTPYAQATYRFIAEDGHELLRGRYQFTVADKSVQALIQLANLPELVNQFGTVEIQMDYPNAGIYDDLYFTGLAIQTDNSGSSTVVPSMAAASWRAARYGGESIRQGGARR